jgi:hypothetical protein
MIRPEVLVFMRAAETMIRRAFGAGVPFSDEEATAVATCLRTLGEFLQLDDNLKDRH